MEKFTVDIDKVLDAFEESEAEAEQNRKASESEKLFLQKSMLNKNDLLPTHLYEDSLLTQDLGVIKSSTSLKNFCQLQNADESLQTFICLKSDLPPPVNNLPLQQTLLSLSYGESPSHSLDNATANSSISLKNTELAADRVVCQDKEKNLPDLYKSNTYFSSCSINEDLLQEKHNHKKNSFDIYNVKNSDLCVEKNLFQIKTVENDSNCNQEKSKFLNLFHHIESPGKFLNTMNKLSEDSSQNTKSNKAQGSLLKVDNSDLSPQKSVNTSEPKLLEISNCIESLSTDCIDDKSSIEPLTQDFHSHLKENLSLPVTKSEKTGVENNSGDKISCTAPTVTSKIEVAAEKDSQVSDAVGFSNVEGNFNMSLEEMDEYLNDVEDLQPLQDEDSGVSSQEDLNGNNVSVETFDKGSPQNDTSCTKWKLASEIVPDAHMSVTKCDIENQGLDLDSTTLKLFENNSLHNNSTVSHESNLGNDTIAGIQQCSEPAVALASDLRNISTAAVTNSNAEQFETGILQSSEIAQTCDSETHSVENRLDPEDLIEKQVLNNLISQDDQVQITNELDETETEKDSVEHINIPRNDLEEDSGLEPDKNQLCAQRLQRPTTLNLPSRTVLASQDTPSFEPSVQPAAYCDTLNEESHIDNPFDLESPPYDQASDLMSPYHENENHLPQIGMEKPFWIPDSSAANCMHCNIKFTVIKRRHHCRACGKVLCSRCCNQKARLSFLQNKEDRVCLHCFEILSIATQTEHLSLSTESPASSSCGSSPSFSPAQVNSNVAQNGHWRPNSNNPDDYCSTISPLQQVDLLAKRPPPTVMVPVGVLKRDGIRPGGDLTDLTEPVETLPPYRGQGRRRVDKVTGEGSFLQSPVSIVPVSGRRKVPRYRFKRIMVSDSDGPLPPILLPHDHSGVDKLDFEGLMLRLRDEQQSPVVFAVTKNVHVLTKIAKLDCCYGKESWCFTSHGLCTVGQDEVLLILECIADEDVIPRDVFRVFSTIYDNASKGSTVGELGHILFPDGIFGSWDHWGFLFIRPTLQCLSKLVLPSTPFLVALLIQKGEVPWAKVFPLRLMLRLGAECKYYPCSLVSVRFRKPVFFEIGQTIMSVLSDLRNFQFTIPFVPGLVVLIYMEEKKTCVNIPRNRYEKLMKVLNSNNVEHVLALGSNFSTDADSHLVCTQKEEGEYQTQAINIEHTTRKVTGASFIVFSGALKSSTGLTAKFSIVEDGLLVQIPQDTMASLHSALRDMRDLTINCGQVNADPEEVVVIQWTSDDKKFNMGVISPVDGTNLEGVSSLRIHTSTDYAGENYLIRWTEIFFLDVDRNENCRRADTIDPCRLAETLAQACCMALIPYLDSLADADMTRLGLRVILDAERDKVEYEVGAQGQPLPTMYMNALDSSLIPVISRITSATQDEPLALELTFHILMK